MNTSMRFRDSALIRWLRTSAMRSMAGISIFPIGPARYSICTTAGRARTERAIADQCDADRAGRIIRILKRHTDRLVRARQQIAARINHKVRGSAFAFAV